MWDHNMSDMSFTTTASLEQNVTIPSGTTPFTTGQPEDHVETQRRQRSFECNQGGKCFTDDTYLKRKVKKPFKCDSHLKQHDRRHTGNTIPEKNSAEEKRCECAEEKRYECAEEKRYECAEEKRFECAEEKRYECAQCGMCFKQPGRLRVHMRMHTGSGFNDKAKRHKDFSQKKNSFECIHCGKYSSLTESNMRHEVTKPGEIPFRCSQCAKSFNFASSLRRHVRLLHSKTEEICTKGESTFSISDLLVNSVIPAEEKRFGCVQCGMCFKQPERLRMHRRMHTGSGVIHKLKRHKDFSQKQNSFKCIHCGKCTSLAEGNKRHEVTKPGEKPFRCSQCVKSFNLASSLRRHVRISHSKTEEICKKGESTFSISELLVNLKESKQELI